MIFDFTLTGKTPLLLHADDIQQADDLKGWRDDSKNAALSIRGDDRSPAWTWMTYLYSDGSQVVMPSDNIMAALRAAGAKVPLKKGTFKSLTQSGLYIPAEFCALAGTAGPITKSSLDGLRELPFAEQAEAVAPLGMTLFVKRVRINQSKNIRVRPRLDAWTVTGRVEIVNPDIKPAKLAEIFAIAGDLIGLGDWRPSAKTSPGPFGRFDVKLSAA